MPAWVTTEVIVAAIGLIGIFLTAVMTCVNTTLARRQGRSVDQINNSVNHAEDRMGPGAKTLYELAWENHKVAGELMKWKSRYDGTVFDSTESIEKFVDTTSERFDGIDEKLGEIAERVEDVGCPYRVEHGPQPPDVNCGGEGPTQ